MKTYVAKKNDIKSEWYVIDADGQVLGRLATTVATLLMGKHRPIYTPHIDSGDHVVVVNAAGIKLTGKKFEEKTYYSHSTYPGGLQTHTYRQVIEKFPTRPFEMAVKRMLPKNRLQAKRIKRLHVYVGPEHDHKAQKLVAVK
jgi:large subunit ribosomal protein L13